jgi:hypothetical protein
MKEEIDFNLPLSTIIFVAKANQGTKGGGGGSRQNSIKGLKNCFTQKARLVQ